MLEYYINYADEYIDAESDNDAEYIRVVIKKIKNIYKNLKKADRPDFVKAMQIRGLRCTYCYNDFKIIYIDSEPV